MSWASRRRVTYAAGLIILLCAGAAALLFKLLDRPTTCADGIQNQGETAIDKGGPCPILDENFLTPVSVSWARSFEVRDGLYSAAAYIENANKDAGVRAARYHFRFYDDKNVIVAEREGVTPIMAGSVTPIFESGIETGNRDIARTYVEFPDALIWERLENPAAGVKISNKELTETDAGSRLSAYVENTALRPVSDLSLVAVIFSPAGNARAGSKTTLGALSAGDIQQVVFTWPSSFGAPTGRVDILPLVQGTGRATK